MFSLGAWYSLRTATFVALLFLLIGQPRFAIAQILIVYGWTFFLSRLPLPKAGSSAEKKLFIPLILGYIIAVIGMGLFGGYSYVGTGLIFTGAVLNKLAIVFNNFKMPAKISSDLWKIYEPEHPDYCMVSGSTRLRYLCDIFEGKVDASTPYWFSVGDVIAFAGHYFIIFIAVYDLAKSLKVKWG